jgi:hypothetical protein
MCYGDKVLEWWTVDLVLAKVEAPPLIQAISQIGGVCKKMTKHGLGQARR